MVPFSIVILAIVILIVLELIVGRILFSFKNDVATKITKKLMKTQGISCARTMEYIDERIEKIAKDQKESK